jgi:hypothetical protein
MNRRPDDRGVSDVVSFVLVFSLVIGSVGLVTAFGLGTLQGVQEAERADAAERAFVVFARGIEGIEDGTRPTYRSELDISGATLAVSDGATVDVNVTGTGYDETVQLGAIEYRAGDTTFSYESGGVFRQDRDSSIAVVEPSFDCRDDHATVSLVELRAGGSRAVGGSVASVRVERRSAVLDYPDTRDDDTEFGVNATGVRVTTTSARWQSYFERSDDWTGTGTGPFDCAADRVFVRHTVVEVALRT